MRLGGTAPAPGFGFGIGFVKFGSGRQVETRPPDAQFQLNEGAGSAASVQALANQRKSWEKPESRARVCLGII